MATNSSRHPASLPKLAVKANSIAGTINRTTATETPEVQLMQQHGIGGNKLLTLQSIQFKAGRCGWVQGGQTRPDGVETFDCAAIVVLVVASQQFL
jgi:hypothetical protein